MQAASKSQAADEYGVVYSARFGARCPKCRSRNVPGYKWMPWDRDQRIRYHKCKVCGAKFKSVETDYGYNL
mgnify:CR=1 FL=1